MNLSSVPANKKVVIFITSSAPSLVRFRLALIKLYLSHGYRVVCSAPSFDSCTLSTLNSLDVQVYSIAYDRRSRNPFVFLSAIYKFYFFFYRLKPSVTFAYFLLPILLSTPASFLAKVPKRFIYFEGLGSIFTDNPFLSLKDRFIVFLLRPLLWVMLHFSCALSTRSLFINSFDCHTILPYFSLVRNSTVTGPIGLDISEWANHSIPATFDQLPSPPIVLFIGRLIYSKGIHQFVKVSQLVKESIPGCRFVVLGGLEYGFDSVPESKLQFWVSSGLIEWLGHVSIVDWVKQSTCLLLPTFYREGSPRSIQEVMAIGRPVISSRIPSVESIVEHGVTGFLADPFDVETFSSYVISLVSSQSLWSSVAFNARSYAIRHFDADFNARRIYDDMNN